ncbi:HNH endonuclease [Mycobacterium phage Typha]|uniref:HNH endonuclease n=1 Tax=Mycobacterium phage Typha TaxID=2517971 RepID=A0A482JAR1_9CAUD|nr:HNH endonuclease [Mycobacterium phage Typha]QBP29784.1 HNH endonuclease [Mycobacterium phage Typha]
MTEPKHYPTTTTPEFDRHSGLHKRLKADYRKDCRDRQERCWLCLQPIDYELAYPHPESFSLDHALPVSTHPELGNDPMNFRPAHLVCNQMRGDEEPHIDLGTPSESW